MNNLVTNQITAYIPHTPSLTWNKNKYDDVSSTILLAILKELPKNQDNKAQMKLAHKIRTSVMQEIGKL